jgi:hypothetical protein
MRVLLAYWPEGRLAITRDGLRPLDSFTNGRSQRNAFGQREKAEILPMLGGSDARKNVGQLHD